MQRDETSEDEAAHPALDRALAFWFMVLAVGGMFALAGAFVQDQITPGHAAGGPFQVLGALIFVAILVGSGIWWFARRPR